MLKSTTLAITAALVLSASAMPAFAFERGDGHGGGKHHNDDSEDNSGNGIPFTRDREGGAGVPGPVEGVGLPFLLAGGAVALAIAMRKRDDSAAASDDRAS